MASRAMRPLFRTFKYHRLQLQKSRHFLTAAYRCEESWNKRLDDPLVSSVNLVEYYYDLDRKYKQEGKVSAIDVDLFMNRIDNPNTDGIVEEIEELVRRLRRSPETNRTLPSTSHAVLRVLLDGGHTHTLLQLLTEPMMYGIFPDHYTCNLLMHTFLHCKDYTAAARVASYLMLQEDFGPPLTQALALASCYCYITADDTGPWEDYAPKVEEPKEEVNIRVKYLRNPYFDDHFDLKEPHHIVGKSLAWLSPLLDGVVGRSCEVLGWALYSKWTELQDALDHLITGKEQIAASVITRIKGLTDAIEDSDVRERLLLTLSRLEAVDSQVVDVDLWPLITQLTQKAAQDAETLDIKTQEEVYKSWKEKREKEYQNQVEDYRKKQLLAEIESKKKDLEAREDVIFFFDNKEKLEMVKTKKKYDPSQQPVTRRYRKKKPRKVDEDYIPPEIRRN